MENERLQPLTFTVPPDDRRKVAVWMRSHPCDVREDSFGASVSYQFTPSGIGTSAKALCPCGLSLDLTDYTNW